AAAIGQRPAAPDASPAAPARYSASADSAAPSAASTDSATPIAASAQPALAARTGAGPAGQDNATAAPAAAPANTGAWGVHAPGAAQPQAQPGADSVKLAGPPAAWRETLHDALGERLQLQLGNNLQQAVIRLDPPMLGRVEIAIRHAAGSLEVTLSATNGEVLRQLHTVSDSLRNDLAQRQYTEVAVTVVPAPRSSAGANPFAGDPQGRGRQPGRDQDDQAPGLALNDAGTASSTFSLNGRE
ncbi:MAG: flagellar hook-length control protein FliK, partial [Massilia sp.]